MRRRSRLALIVLTVLCAFTCALGLVACGGAAKDAIEKYILPENETLVSADFKLPKKIGNDISVKWKSGNTKAIAIEDGDENNYTAKVTLQPQVTEVKLTISASGASKAFTVRVAELDVYTFLSYKFPQKGVAVKADFDLETSYTVQGQTATISWDIDDEPSKEYISLNAEKNKVIVKPGDDLATVKIKATFTYNGKPAPQTYTFSVSPYLTARQLINNIYSQTEYPVDLSGYILHVSDASASYGNATFFMMDEETKCGYYVYRAAIDAADAEKFVDGAYVTVSGAKATYYNGLWETTQKTGTAVVDESKEKIDPRSTVYDFDTDLISGVPSATWRQSTFVRLTGWKVTAKATKDDGTPKKPSNEAGTSSDLFTITKEKVSINVYISKYIQRSQEDLDGLCKWYDDIQVGDFVTVTGILGNYNGAQIQPVKATDIVKADAESTNEIGPKLKKAVEGVNKEIAKNFASYIIEDKEITMPTTISGADGVEISYAVLTKSTAPTVTYNNGKFTVKPLTVEKGYDVEVTYKVGDKSYYGMFRVKTLKMTSEQVVELIKNDIDKAGMADVAGRGAYALPIPETYGATLTWEVDGTTPAWLKLTDKNVEINNLPATATEITIKVAIAFGEGESAATANTSFKFTVSPDTFQEATAAAAGDSILSVFYKGARRYVTGIDGTYLSTSTDVSAAKKITIAEATNGYTLKIDGKFIEVKGGKLNFADTATANAVWTWNDALKIYTFAEETDTYYIGTYDTSKYDTIGVSNITFIWDTEKNEAKSVLNVTQHPAHFGTPAATFTALDAPKAGTYKFAMFSANKNAMYYALDAMSGSYLNTSADASKAADYVITQIGTDNKYTITVGGKYLEFVPRADTTKQGVDLQLNATQTEGKYWQWVDGIKNFVMESKYNKTDSPDETDLYYLGTYGTYTTMNGNYIGRIADKGEGNVYTPNGKEGVEQWVGHFGTLEGGEEPEELAKPTTADNITETGATVFDFANVVMNAKTDTADARLALFPNATAAGLTSVAAANMYCGNNTTGGPATSQNQGGFLRLGTSKNNGTLTLTFSKKVTKVQILCQGWSASDTIAIEGFEDTTVGNAAKKAVIFELGTSASSINITTAKRVLIYKIAVTFEA